MNFIIPAFLCTVLIIGFAVQNMLLITVDFLNWSFQTPLFLVILGSAVVGALVMLFFNCFSQSRVNKNVKQLLHQQGELEAENTVLQERLNKELAKENK